MSEWLHLSTTNDTNGNPRRLYVEVEDGAIRTVADEGYSGIGAARRAGMPDGCYPLTIHVTPTEYRNLKRLEKKS